MNEREQENFEIGQEVFKDIFNIGKSSSSFSGRAFITDTWPPLRSLRFFYESKLIFNQMNGDIYKFSDFRKETQEEINNEYEYQQSMQNLIDRLIEENRFNEATNEYIVQSIEDSKSRVKDYEKKLLRLKQIKDKGETFDINVIKQIPITDFIEFNRGGFACCPFHGEKTPSLKYYPKQNKCHCFGACQKSFDVIDVFMGLHSVSFREAVKILSKSI